VVGWGGVFSIGYSGRTPDEVFDIIGRYGVEVVVDVRTSPYSARQPQFDREVLAARAKGLGIQYVCAGDKVGGRPADRTLYGRDGLVDFARFSKKRLVNDGISELVTLSRTRKICMICAEKSPVHCHRLYLLGRMLLSAGVDVAHIVAPDHHAWQSSLQEFLLNKVSRGMDLFLGEAEQMDSAYREAARVARRLDLPVEKRSEADGPSPSSGFGSGSG